MQIIILIIIGAGLMGGLANYHRSDSNQKFSWFNLRKSLLHGLVASAAVPLFLKMVSSDLISTTELPDNQWHYLVIAGFCLVAAFFSTRFLESIGDRVIKELEEVKQKTQELEEESEDNSAKVDILVSKEVGATKHETRNDDGFESKGIGLTADDKDLSDEEKVLRYFENNNYSFRNIESIAKACKIDKSELSDILDALKKKNKLREFSNKQGETIFALID